MKPSWVQRAIFIIAILLFVGLGVLWYVQGINDNARAGTLVEMVEPLPAPTTPSDKKNTTKPASDEKNASKPAPTEETSAPASTP